MSIFKYFYKTTSTNLTETLDGRCWDIFISAYTKAERVRVVYDAVNAKCKKWIAFPEYDFSCNDIDGSCYFSSSTDEAEVIISFFCDLAIVDTSKSICVDITGFIRPYLAFLVSYIKRLGFKKLDLIYSEPTAYKNKEDTKFSHGKMIGIRQIRGFEGVHNNNTSNDILIINSGYDDYAIASIAEYKRYAKKYQLIGFPSLKADMYQQCLLKVHKAQEAIGRSVADDVLNILSPANDPFITAQHLKENVDNINILRPITNLYLSPLATKAQLVGMVLYALMGNPPCATSLIFPFLSKYSQETSDGLSRTWLYTVEFPY